MFRRTIVRVGFYARQENRSECTPFGELELPEYSHTDRVDITLPGEVFPRSRTFRNKIDVHPKEFYADREAINNAYRRMGKDTAQYLKDEDVKRFRIQNGFEDHEYNHQFSALPESLLQVFESALEEELNQPSNEGEK